MRKKLPLGVILLVLFVACAGRQKGEVANVHRNDLATFRLDDMAKGGHGTAVVLDRAGYLLTCHHVVFTPKDELRTLVVNIAVGNRPAVSYPVKVLAHDKALDLVVLKVDFHFPSAVVLGDIRDVNVLDAVYAIGFPFDLGRMAAYGHIKNVRWNYVWKGFKVKDGLAIEFSDGNGMSGGGAFLARSGVMIGLLHLSIPAHDDDEQISDNRQARIRVAVPVDLIRAWLDRTHIPYHLH